MAKVLNFTFTFLLSTSLFALPYAEAKSASRKMKCVGIVADLTKPSNPLSVELIPEDQQFGVIYTGQLSGVKFVVTMDKPTGDITGEITAGSDMSYTFAGAPSSNGRFEYGSDEGGNLTMPEKSLGLRCETIP